jgi:hypothetical protein
LRILYSYMQGDGVSPMQTELVQQEFETSIDKTKKGFLKGSTLVVVTMSQHPHDLLDDIVTIAGDQSYNNYNNQSKVKVYAPSADIVDRALDIPNIYVAHEAIKKPDDKRCHVAVA